MTSLHVYKRGIHVEIRHCTSKRLTGRGQSQRWLSYNDERDGCVKASVVEGMGEPQRGPSAKAHTGATCYSEDYTEVVNATSLKKHGSSQSLFYSFGLENG